MTAEEFRIQQNLIPDLSPLKIPDGIILNGNQRIEKLMIEFAKFHVQKALIEQAKLAKKCMINKAPVPSIDFLNNSYPLTNIK